MANIVETSEFTAGVYLKETTDLVLGGTDGISNLAETALANRTRYLKDQQDNLKIGVGFSAHVIGAGTIERGALKSHMRQCILSASMSAQGFANHLQTSAFTDQVLIVASEAEPLVLSAAAGYGQHGAIDYYIHRDSNLPVTISGVPVNDDPVYVARTVNTTTGAINTVFTTIEPIYRATAPSHLDGQQWFNTRSQRWFQSDGSEWSSINPRVFIGVATRNGSGEVQECIPYEVRQEVDPDLVGVIQMYAANSRAPYGWEWCRGQELERLKYPALFAAIGETYGAGDGSTTFLLPDLRGEFVRGFDPTTAIADTAFGQKATAAFPGHSHEIDTIEVASGTGATVAAPFDTGGAFTSNVGTFLGVGGVRPRNMALNFIIKLF